MPCLRRVTMKVDAKKIIIVAVSSALIVLFIILLFFVPQKIPVTPETNGEIEYSITTHLPDGNYESEDLTAVIGKDVTAVSIENLTKLNKISKVNYVPNKFVNTLSLDPDVQIVDLTKPFNFAEKGTLIFIFKSLDPEDRDFIKKKQKLADFKIGENWQFTLSLPKIFNASNVYNHGELVARNGDIENYKYIDYSTSYDKVTEEYSPKVTRTTIDLKFYTKRDAITLYKFVTIHYQSSGTAYSGIMESPFIGTEEAVTSTYVVSQSLLISSAIFALMVFFILVVLSVLKRTTSFISAIIWLFGISFILLPKYMLGGVTAIPLLWVALSYSSAFVLVLGAILSVSRNFGKFPAKIIAVALTALGGVLAFISPFVPFGAFRIMHTVYVVIKAISAIIVIFFALVAISCNERYAAFHISTINIIGIGTLASVFIPNALPVYSNSIFWLCVVVVAFTFFAVFKVFNETEKANVYLTNNLKSEVARQTEELKAIIAERDKLLRYLSHDMKKPINSIGHFVMEIRKNEANAENVKALDIIDGKLGAMQSDLAELQKFVKLNFVAEPSETLYTDEVVQGVYQRLCPDCEANGISLKINAPKIAVFAKKNILNSVMDNLVFNAIEHSKCSVIIITAAKGAGVCKITVTDDGMGIENGNNVFLPYYSGNDEPDNLGLGLYICRQHLLSMGGDLTYSRENERTVFTVVLNPA